MSNPEMYQVGQDDYQEWLQLTIQSMMDSGLYDQATLEELMQRTY